MGQNHGEYFWENSTGCPDGKKKIWSSKLDSNNNATTTNGHLFRGRIRQIKLRNVSAGKKVVYRVQLIEHPILRIPNLNFPNLRCVFFFVFYITSYIGIFGVF